MPLVQYKTPDQLFLKIYYRYDPETGIFSNLAGEYLGGKTSTGYLRVYIQGRYWPLHRIIYKYMTGEEPEIIDHINGNKVDNRWINLRSVSHQTNLRNSKLSENSTTGYIGVRYDPSRKKFRSYIRIEGKTVYLGDFNCPTNAYVARLIYMKNNQGHGYAENHGKVRTKEQFS